MKKCLLIIPCISSLFTYAAEFDKHNMCLVGNTLFLVSKGDMLQYQGILGVMVFGKIEQDRFKESVSKEEHNVIGTVFGVEDRKIYVLSKTSESASSDDSYKLFTQGVKLHKKAAIEEVKSDLLHVIEPVVLLKDSGKQNSPIYSYSPYRMGVENPHAVTCHNFLEDTALEQAGNDLRLCYQNALVKGLELIKNKENKSIGLVTLGTETGFPREHAISITFKEITDFLEVNNGYTFVQLFIKKRSELKKYKELMMEYNEKRRK